MNANVVLARPDLAQEYVDAELSQYLTFNLSGQMYSLPLQHVREIIQYRDVATVPMMPDCVRGIINLRGSVIPVIDLAARFGGVAGLTGKRSVILILEMLVEEKRHIYGVMVDAVSEVLALSAADIEPAPAFGTKLRNEFIAGVAKHNGDIMLILELGTILLIDK